LAKKLDNLNQGVIQLTSSGCQPAYSFESNTPGCTKWIRESMKYLQDNNKITNVVLVFRHSFYLFGDQLQVYPNIPNRAPGFISNSAPITARETYWNSFEQMIQLLRKSGKKVYLVDPIPELGTFLSKYIFNNNILQATRIDKDVITENPRNAVTANAKDSDTDEDEYADEKFDDTAYEDDFLD
jgi:hypothetical protein